VAGCREDRAVVCLEHVQPVGDVRGVFLTRLKRQIKVGTEDRSTEFRHEFFDCVRLLSCCSCVLHCHTGASLILVILDPRDPRPLYLQIMDEVRRALVAGTLRPEDPMPSVRELSSQLVVNPRTVSQAYQELEREGVLYVRRGQGTFVSPAVRADRRAVAREVATRALLDARRSGLGVKELIETIRKVATEEVEEPLVPASNSKRGDGK
jgi:GntR family transcriptional regulator